MSQYMLEGVVEAMLSLAKVYTIRALRDFGETCILVMYVCSVIALTKV